MSESTTNSLIISAIVGTIKDGTPTAAIGLTTIDAQSDSSFYQAIANVVPQSISSITEQVSYVGAIIHQFTNGVAPSWYTRLASVQQSYLVSNLVPEIGTTLSLKRATTTQTGSTSLGPVAAPVATNTIVTTATPSTFLTTHSELASQSISPSIAPSSSTPALITSTTALEPSVSPTTYATSTATPSIARYQQSHVPIIAGVSVPCGLLLVLLICELLIFKKLRHQSRERRKDQDAEHEVTKDVDVNGDSKIHEPSSEDQPPSSGRTELQAPSEPRQRLAEMPALLDIEDMIPRPMHSERDMGS